MTRRIVPARLLWLLAVLAGVLAVAANPTSASAAPFAGTRVGASDQIFAARTGVSAAELVATQQGNTVVYGEPAPGDLFAEEAGAAAGDTGRAAIAMGHGARHLAGTGLNQGEVESAIQSQVRQSVSGASSTGSFWGRVTVGGQTIEYRAYTLPDGTINVGTYYVVP